MAINKVVFGDTTLIDLSSTTATSDSILKGYGCFGADGEWINGTSSGGSGSYDIQSIVQGDGTQHIEIVDSSGSEECTHYVEGGECVTFYADFEPYAISIVKGDKSIPEPQAPSLSSGAFVGWVNDSGEDVTFPYNPQGDESLWAKVEYPVPCTEIKAMNSASICDLGIKCASDYIVQVDFTPITANGTAYFGNRPVNDDDEMRLFGAFQNRWYLDFGNGTTGRISSSAGTLELNTPYRIEFGNRYVKDLDSDTIYTSGTRVDAFEKSYNFRIGGGDSLIFRNAKFIRDNEVFAEFVPCVLMSSGKCYVMDIVSGKQYPCEGSWQYSI